MSQRVVNGRDRSQSGFPNLQRFFALHVDRKILSNDISLILGLVPNEAVEDGRFCANRWNSAAKGRSSKLDLALAPTLLQV